MPERIKRINQLILQELAGIVLREIEFAQGVLTTLQKVETSKDLQQARVFVAVFPESKAPGVLAMLNKQAKHLHYLVSQRIRLRCMPHLRFVLEKDSVKIERLEGLLDEIALENKEKDK